MQEAQKPTFEPLQNAPEIKSGNGVINIVIPHVDLPEGQGINFEVTLEKLPTPAEDGTKIGCVTVDRESPKLQTMLTKAQNLKTVPEQERPRKIMELVRSGINYAYNDVLGELEKQDPELASWVAKNIGLNSGFPLITLSKVVDSGHGICQHLSAAIVVLAKEAGMEAAFITNSGLKNVMRKDNGKPIFKMGLADEIIHTGHAWAELKTSEGKWIPVDPSAQLVGDTADGLATFQEAGYNGNIAMAIEFEGFPRGVSNGNLQDLNFRPGEGAHTGILEIKSMKKVKPIVLRQNSTGEIVADVQDLSLPEPNHYKGPLNFQISSKYNFDGVMFAPIGAELAKA